MAIKFKQNINDAGVEIPSTEQLNYEGQVVNKVIWVENGVSNQVWTKEKLLVPVYRVETSSHYQKKIYIKNNNTVSVTLRYSNAESSVGYPSASNSYTIVTLLAGAEILVYTLSSSTTNKYYYTGKAYFSSSGWNDSNAVTQNTTADKRIASLTAPDAYVFGDPLRGETTLYISNENPIEVQLKYSEASQVNSYPNFSNSYITHPGLIPANTGITLKVLYPDDLLPKFYRYRLQFSNNEVLNPSSSIREFSEIISSEYQKPLVYVHTSLGKIAGPTNKTIYIGGNSSILLSILLPLPEYNSYGLEDIINSNIGAVSSGPYITLTDNGVKNLSSIPGGFSSQGYHYLVKQYIISNTTPENGATYSNTIRIGAGKDDIGWNYNIDIQTYKPAGVPD